MSCEQVFPFFSNTECPQFPCHEGVSPQDFNCAFCYCPLYALGDECGGNFVYTDKGIKSCQDCCLPHVKTKGVDLVCEHWPQLRDMASR